jgi:hypothetical protein
MKYSGRIGECQNIEFRFSTDDRGQFVLELLTRQCY